MERCQTKRYRPTRANTRVTTRQNRYDNQHQYQHGGQEHAVDIDFTDHRGMLWKKEWKERRVMQQASGWGGNADASVSGNNDKRMPTSACSASRIWRPGTAGLPGPAALPRRPLLSCPPRRRAV